MLKRFISIVVMISSISCSLPQPGAPSGSSEYPSAVSSWSQASVPLTDPAEGLKNALEAYNSGDWKTALVLAGKVEHGFPGSEWHKRSLFLKERALIQLDLPSEADAAMLAVQALYPELADYAVYILAEYHFSKGRYTQAASLYGQLAGRYPKSLLTPRASFRHGQALAEASLPAQAAEVFEQFLRNYPRSEFCAEACLGLGKALMSQADPSGAARAYRDVLVKYPGTSMDQPAQSALTQLGAGGLKVRELNADELYRRGLNLFQAGQHDRAADAFKKLLAADSRFPNRADVMLKTGIALFNAGKRADAAAILETMIRTYPRDQRMSEALYYTARSYSRSGDSEKAVKFFKKLLSAYPGSEWADDALFVMANIYKDSNDTKKALLLFNRVAKEYPGSKFADSSIWWQAWTYYSAGEYGKTEQKLQELVSAYPRSFLVNQALYWQGRASEKRDHVQHAAVYYGKLLKRAPYSYYGYRAGERLAAIDPAAPAIKMNFSPDLEPCESESCSGEQTEDSESDDGPPVWTAEALKMLSSDPSFVKSRELLHLAMKKEAAAELWALQDRLPRRRGALIGLSKTFFELGDYYRSLMLVLRNYDRYLEGEAPKTPEDFWTLAYPQGYWDSILSYSRKYGQDPYFIAAIIRQESQFRAEAVSPAGARGVMQVMPATGEWVARNIRLRGFETAKLYDSDTGIQIGTWYIGNLMKRFKGDAIFVAAAYNAGPEAVSSWLSRNLPEGDEFVESIPYQETRGYVKKVLRNYAEYKRIYGKDIRTIMPVMTPDEETIETHVRTESGRTK